jgi:hypothetical protein
VIWVKREEEYFCKADWTTQITLIRLNNLASARTSVARAVLRSPDAALRNPGTNVTLAPDCAALHPGYLLTKVANGAIVRRWCCQCQIS